MKRRRSAADSVNPEPRVPASNMLNIEVTLVPKVFGLSVVHGPERPNVRNLDLFEPDPGLQVRGAEALSRLGFKVTAIGRMSISVKAPRDLFTRTFGTRLSLWGQIERMSVPGKTRSFYYPEPGAVFEIPELLQGVVDAAYIQWPYILMARAAAARETPIPPRIRYHHLRVPGDVSLLLNADRVHRQGITGRGVKIAMLDSGFYTAHPYFKERGYSMSCVLAPGATEVGADGNGHGTAECANILSIAPDATFIGIKLNNEADPSRGASMAEGIKFAVAQRPDVLSVSMGYDLTEQGTRNHLGKLPNSLRPLEAEINAAVRSGITVVFSAGNGHVAFPGMMPEVISAGGTYVDEKMGRQASDYASAFESKIYPGRRVPDVTGLVGMVATQGAYLMLPLQPGCEIDRGTAKDETFPDGTAAGDGWAVISGTSAAAPQVAGVCALLKQKNPGLTPSDIKEILKRTARDVVKGHASAASNENTAIKAGPGPDGATGNGLVDAYEAWKQA